MGIFDTPNPTYANLATSSQTMYAPWYENAASGAYSGLAGAVANANANLGQAYNGAGGVALTPSLEQEQLDAFGRIKGNAGTWQPGFAQANQFLGGAQGRLGERYTPNGIATGQWGQQATADKYMNPYIQNVLDVGARRLNTNFDIQQTKANDQAAMAGAFGGSRQGVLQAQIEKDRGQAVSDLYTTGLASAYQNAQNMFTSDQARGLTAQTADEAAKARAAQLGLQAGQLGLQGTQIAQGLGTATSQLGYNDANALMGIGNFLYDRQQQSINNTYNDWLRQNQSPISNYQSLLQGLGAARTGQTTSGTSQQAIPGVSTASQIGGLATTALGGLGLLNQSGALSGLGNLFSSGYNTISDGLSNIFSSGTNYAQSLADGIIPLATGGPVKRPGLGFAMGGTVVGSQIAKPGNLTKKKKKMGILGYADGGAVSMDDVYAPVEGATVPIDWQQQSASEFEGMPVGEAMTRLNRLLEHSVAAGNNARAAQVARIMKTLYPQQQKFGDNYVIGTDPRTQQVSEGNPSNVPLSPVKEVEPPAPSGIAAASQFKVPYGLPGSGVWTDIKDWLSEKPGLPSSASTAQGESVPLGRTRGGTLPTNQSVPDETTPSKFDSSSPMPVPVQSDPNTSADEAPTGIAKAMPAPRRSGSIAGGSGPAPIMAPQAAPGVEPVGPEGGGAYPPGGMVMPPQKGLGAFAGPSTPAQAIASEKPFDPLKSGWMPVVQAGLRMMAAKPGQSFVQNLGEAGETAIKGLESQARAENEEKKLANETRKVDLSEREVKVKEGLLPDQKKLYQAHADYYNHQVKTGKMTPVGIDKDSGDALFYNSAKDQIESVPGVTTPQAYTAIMTKQMALEQARAQMAMAAGARADALAERREGRIIEQDRKERELQRRMDEDFSKNFENERKLWQGNVMNMGRPYSAIDEAEILRSLAPRYGKLETFQSAKESISRSLQREYNGEMQNAKGEIAKKAVREKYAKVIDGLR